MTFCIEMIICGFVSIDLETRIVMQLYGF